MSKGQVADIEFYRKESLPKFLAEEAKKQEIELADGIVAVKLLIASPPKYEFFSIGKNPANVKKFFHQLARDDGGDLNEIVKKLITEE